MRTTYCFGEAGAVGSMRERSARQFASPSIAPRALKDQRGPGPIRRGQWQQARHLGVPSSLRQPRIAVQFKRTGLRRVRWTQSIIRILNSEFRLSKDPDLTRRVSRRCKPEVPDLLICVDKMNAVHPERRIACGLAFNPNDGIVVAVNPNLAADQILVWGFWQDLEHVCRASFKCFLTNSLEVVVRGNKTCAGAGSPAGRFGLFAQQFLKNVLANRA